MDTPHEPRATGSSTDAATRSGEAIRPELFAALGEEIVKLDRVIARTWQVLALTGVVAGTLVSTALGLPQGLAVAAICVASLGWFSLQLRWLGGPHHLRAVRMGALLEACLPIAFLIAIARAQGAAYALGSYVPPMMFAAVVLAATARLRPRVILWMGSITGVAFVGLYFGWLRGELDQTALANPLYSASMQITRGVTFVVAGVVAYVISESLRRAVGRAERAVRAQDLFGKYRLGTKLGAGGMGVVHRAVYSPEGGFERSVAVKLLHAHLADQPRFLQGFRHEAELSAQLAHPNIVQVLDFGRIGSSYFLAMEHVDGMTLGGIMRRLAARGRRVDPSVVAWLGIEILTGLSYSHAGARDREGKLLYVIHRDLCPQNVLISAHGEVKISDFGVAKALGESSFSETKTIAGHAGYMAPEQARAEPLDARCDLFAVGVVLWELLCNEPLFRRGSEGATLLALLAGDVPTASSKCEGLSTQWDAFFRKALAGHPSHRFPSAEAMSQSLAQLRPEAGSAAESWAELVHWAQSIPLTELETSETAQTQATAVTRLDRPS